MKSLKILGIIVGVALVLGGYLFPKGIEAPITASAVGDTQSTAKIAQIVANMATSTYGSLYNSDANDRMIDSVFYTFNGLSTMNSINTTALDAAWIQAGTSTDSYRIGADPINRVLFSTFATTSPTLYVSSTTPGLVTSADYRRIWKAGTYLNFVSGTTTTSGYNGAATSSTATGIVGVKYFSL